MPREIWRAVPGYPGYEVSSHGRVRSYRAPKYLRPEAREKGRLSVWLMLCGRPRRQAVHRLVLLAFAGPPPPACEACHNDGDPRNNRVENLRWDTHRNNMLDKRQHGTQPAGARHPSAKLTSADARRIKTLLRRGWRGAELARRFGVSGTTISEIKRGRHWTGRAE